MPDAVHSHYADAGHVGVRVASFLGRPLVHTGHSLGRVKRRRLLASGLSDELIEKRYHILGRIQAEEETLACAELVITSTQQEIEEQYGFYGPLLPGGDARRAAGNGSL
jgi:sucrose-phosphate synthase